ncbi:uncharacterized protein LOC114521951 [Dendronephthya gigantea]|uniref:uncharacterized protein LOC114521951 n=1 Tax=Dendronephthya gigantea TaxID=151771 RepID=UPI001069DFE2|nr:uncharacterized protein LOC114521951 [Dendronephthya gigantea]
MDATRRKEWEDLNESERNCLMWPDFLQWGEPDKVKIYLDNAQTSLGLVSVAVQDPMTREWYHISKRIKENQPAHGLVEPYKWITKVNGKDANLPTEEFSKLFKNGQPGIVHLSMKKTIDPLTKFVKKWQNERTITGNGKTIKEGVTLVHFYSKENEEIKDHILVWEVKPETEVSLFRGDEILAVNDQSIQGKKLALIYKLISSDQTPAEVKLKIREIERDNPSTDEGVEQTNIKTQQSIDPSVNPAVCLVVTKEMDINAGREMPSEVFENSFSNIKESQTADAVPEGFKTPSQEENKKKGKMSSLRRRLSSSSSSASPNSDTGKMLGTENDPKNQKILEVENPGYKNTPPHTPPAGRKRDKTCNACSYVSLQPDDRNSWPIYKMENAHFEKICVLLDLPDRSREPLLSVLGCFSVTEVAEINQRCGPTGVGTARIALIRWGNYDRKNNVGALKKILNERMKRNDVLDVIEEWEKLPVCHGCCIRLTET